MDATFSMVWYELTCNSATRIENCVDFWVHLNLIFFLSSKLMPGIDNSINPLLKWSANFGINDISYVLPRQRLPFSCNCWKACHHRWPCCSVIKHALNLQALEVGYGYVPHVSIFDPGLLTGCKLLHVIYSHCIIFGQVSTAVMCQEAIHLSLALEFGSECSGVDTDFVGCITKAVVLIRSVIHHFWFLNWIYLNGCN